MKTIILMLLMALPLPAARDWTGTTDKITLAEQVSGNTFSVSIWAYIDSAGSSGFGNLWRRASSTTVLYINSTEIVFEVDFTAGSDGQWGFARPSTGTWHNIVLTYNGSAAANDPILYVDGVSQTITGDGNPTGTFLVGTGGYMIGNNVAATQPFDGRLAEFAEWTRVLTASEVGSLADGFSPDFLLANRTTYVPMVRNVTNFQGAAPTVVGTAVIEHPRVIETEEFYGTYFASTTSAIVNILNLNNRRRRQ